jgi:energy-converting hydrogenase Eha subunit E
MKNLLISLVSGFILAIPALLGTVANAGCFKGEYFAFSYTLVLGCFGLGSFGVGSLAPWFDRRGYGKWKTFWLLFGGACLAWFAALIVLGALNLTPLCIGQNNGDGINGISECVIQTIAVSLVFTPLALALLAVDAFSIATMFWLARNSPR